MAADAADDVVLHDWPLSATALLHGEIQRVVTHKRRIVVELTFRRGRRCSLQKWKEAIRQDSPIRQRLLGVSRDDGLQISVYGRNGRLWTPVKRSLAAGERELFVTDEYQGEWRGSRIVVAWIRLGLDEQAVTLPEDSRGSPHSRP
jgi:hypothetical protein